MNDRQVLQELSAVCDFHAVLEGDDCVELSFHNPAIAMGGTLRRHHRKLWCLTQINRFTALRKLNLRKCQMRILPEFATRSLETLDLSCNSLQRIPDWVLKQPNLQELNIGANQLTTIPAELINQPLTVLKLHKNKLTYLPPLSYKLRVLNLFLNNLSEIPQDVLLMHDLESLAFGVSKLDHLPSFATLSNLRWLTLAINEFNTIPDDLCGLTKLETLVLAKNKLTQLPAAIGDLTALRSLTVYHNDISRLPASFYDLRLRRLNVARNPLTNTRVQEVFGDIEFFRM